MSDLVPGDFIHVIGDAHVYRNHVRPLEEQLQNLPKPFPVSVLMFKVITWSDAVGKISTFWHSFNCIYAFCLLTTFTMMQTLKINPEKKDIDSFVAADIKLIGYDPHQKIQMKMAV